MDNKKEKCIVRKKVGGKSIHNVLASIAIIAVIAIAVTACGKSNSTNTVNKTSSVNSTNTSANDTNDGNSSNASNLSDESSNNVSSNNSGSNSVNANNTASSSKTNSSITAKVSKSIIKNDEMQTIDVKGPAGGDVTVVCHYKTKSNTNTGTINSKGIGNVSFKISNVIKGTKVPVDVSVKHDGKIYKSQTTFTVE